MTQETQTSTSNPHELVEMIICLTNNFIPVVITKEAIPKVTEAVCDILKQGGDHYVSLTSLNGDCVIKPNSVEGFYFRKFQSQNIVDVQKQVAESFKKIADEHSKGEDWKG